MISRMSILRDEVLTRITSLDLIVHQRRDDTCDVLGAEIARNHSGMLLRFADLAGRATRMETRRETCDNA